MTGVLRCCVSNQDSAVHEEAGTKIYETGLHVGWVGVERELASGADGERARADAIAVGAWHRGRVTASQSNVVRRAGRGMHFFCTVYHHPCMTTTFLHSERRLQAHICLCQSCVKIVSSNITLTMRPPH